MNISDWFENRSVLYKTIAENNNIIKQINKVAEIILEAFRHNKKLLIFGNGGSANQAQHFAAELVCRFEKKRKALPAIALTSDTSIITAQGNDLGYETIFSREIEALCQEDDVVIGITTSDTYAKNNHSKNILEGFKTARKKGGILVGFFSKKTKNLIPVVDAFIVVPSENTALIQEVHLSIMHFLCKLVEDEL